jgi:two-component system NarL family response regulator
MADPNARVRVLCVDDHQLVLDGLVLIIGAQPDLEVVGTCRRGDEAPALFRLHRPDVTLMDLQLPGMSGLEAIRTIRAEFPDARIIVVTMYQGDEDIFRALQAGATTYLLKDTLASELVRVIRQVHSGLRPIQPDIEARLAGRSEQRALTIREVDVLKLVSQGLRNKEIAAALDLSEATIQVHVRNIFAKFNVNDRTAAVSVAVRRGIIHI